MPTFKNGTVTDLSSQISKVVDERDSLMVAVMSLGILVGVLVVLLAVVTSGWVWTCWKMKRNKATTTEHVRYNNDKYRFLGVIDQLIVYLLNIICTITIELLKILHTE
jgi:heme/copper-type cytochrome/quinol oxidase subunit 2